MRHRSDDPYGHLLYAGGWLLAPRFYPSRRHWRSRTIGAYRLSFPRHTPVGHAGPVMVLGRPVNPVSGTVGARAAARELAAAVGMKGRFLDQLDQMAGRFIVVVSAPDGPRIYQDAVGSRTVFYRPQVAASHSALAHGDPEALDSHVASVWSRTTRTGRGVRYLPGLRAPHVGVRMLTPNTSLHVPTGTVERFWPRQPRREVEDLDDLTDRVVDLMSATVRLAARSWSLSMSLTAGIDSRLTLASSRQVADRMGYFSHINIESPNLSHQVDLDVAQDMASQLGLSHRTYPLGEPAKGENYAEFARIWRTNMGVARGIPTLMKGYVDAWPTGTLHMRSNVAEIGRVFYRGDRLDCITAASLTRWWNGELRDDADCVAAFSEFCDVTQFTDEAMAGYDPLDVFYWEHRMGSWHAWLCLEADVAHDTFPLYSNRRLLEVMLAAPFDARHDATLFHRAIKRMWPQVAEWPINPKRWIPQSQSQRP